MNVTLSIQRIPVNYPTYNNEHQKCRIKNHEVHITSHHVTIQIVKYFCRKCHTVSHEPSPVLVGADVVSALEVRVEVGPGEVDRRADLALVLTAFLPLRVIR